MMHNFSIMNHFLGFGKRDSVTGRQDREHSVAVLGTTRENAHTKAEIELVSAVAGKLAQKDFDIWTGGCPGIAKSANLAAHNVNPKNSWAVHVKRFLNNRTLSVRNLGIYNEKKDKTGSPVLTESGPERTMAIVEECNHAVIATGGLGSAQEFSVCAEAKAFKSSKNDLCIDDLTLINNNGFYDNLIKTFDTIENDKYKLTDPPYKGLPGFPIKPKTLKEKIINNEVKINGNIMTKADIEKTSTDIVNHIIEESNKNSAEKIPLFKLSS